MSPEAGLLTDSRDGAVSDCCSNPIATQNAWCGDPQEWRESIVDLEAFAGQLVQIRFHLATGSSVGREGCYIDDVKVRSCPNSLIFGDGSDSSDTTVWSRQKP